MMPSTGFCLRFSVFAWLLLFTYQSVASGSLQDSARSMQNAGKDKTVILRRKRALAIPPPLKDSEIPEEILKIWYTNERFDILTLRWGSQGSPELFALFKWRDQASKEEVGSRLYVSHDYGATFRNVTESMQCSGQSTPTALSTIYWTESTTKTIMVTDVTNRCLHVSYDAGYAFKSMPLKFIPSRLEIHPRFDNVVVAHDVDSKPETSHNPKGVWISFNYGATWQNVDDIVAGWRLGVEEFDPQSNCSDCVRVWVFREEAEMPHLKILVYEYTKDGRITQRPIVKKERVNEFEIKGPFMFAVNYDENKRKRTLLVSFRGSSFITANFGNLSKEVVDYHIAHVSQSQAYVALTFENNQSDLYMSGHGDGNFTRSLSDVYFIHTKIGKLPLHSSGVIKTSFHKTQAIVDMHAVDGIDGVLFANQIRRRASRHSSDEEVSEYLVTKMSEDGGSTWHLVKPPMRTNSGDVINCSEVRNNCSLHLTLRFTLHSHTRDPQAMWSSKNAPGLLFAIGNWGTELYEIGNRSLFRSIDGGITWEHSLLGQHMFSVANKGGLVAAVNDAGVTKTVLYSWNYGTTWEKLFLPTGPAPSTNNVTSASPMTVTGNNKTNAFIQYNWAVAGQTRLNVIQILSEPGTNSTVFNVYATPSDSRSYTTHAWIVYRIDLKAIFSGRRCTKSDFSKWSFQDEHRHVSCLLGRKTVYHRRDLRAKCLIEEGGVPAPNVTTCECTFDDYECDVGFSSSNELKHMCLPDGSTPLLPAHCPENSTFLLSHGYRKRPFDSCSGGMEDSMQPVAVPCPDPQQYAHVSPDLTSMTRDGGASNVARICPPQTFDCRKGICIPRYWVCDGEPDCADASDERDCHTMTCQQDEFKCNKTHRCIPNAWKCDAQFDCGGDDMSDEQNCTLLECSDDHFRCLNQTQCIPRQYVCDREADCRDESDELNCTYLHSFAPTTLTRERCDDPHAFDCKGTCIPARWACDGEEDCPDGIDERNCTGQCRQFVCNNGNCVRSELVCDNTDNCGDNSDESSCPPVLGGKNNGTRGAVQPFDPSKIGSSASSSTVVPLVPWQIDEGNDKPDDNEGDNFWNVRCTPDMPHKCKGKPGHADYCIPKKWVCDGTADCIDASDEQNCAGSLVMKPTKKLKFDLNGPQVVSSRNDDGGATVASGINGGSSGTPASGHSFGSTFVVFMLFIIAIIVITAGVLYKQGRLTFLQRRGFAFRRFQNEPIIAMMDSGGRRTSGPYAHPRDGASDEGFVDESLAGYDIMPHSSTSTNRLQHQRHPMSSYSDGLESVTLGIDEQPMFVHFSDGDPLVEDPVVHVKSSGSPGRSSKTIGTSSKSSPSRTSVRT